MQLAEVVNVSNRVAATSGRLEKIGLLADLMRRTPPAEIPILVGFVTGSARQGRMGVGGALLSSLRDVPPAGVPSLELTDVDAAFVRLAKRIREVFNLSLDALLDQTLRFCKFGIQ